eukprot:CAMPEP_0184873576 /NCGR_PEP_ID=MMETSP0580-20130426/41923_1 /TAXON_ID=1118495 /ORGANISM="Dactyliosolen fragilissimus" /LENGTH=399 /DNA_ID=CAMNT_0027376501 /DNA_START=207 /DNA_END=1406 /DNA_ORIENTATION=+
MPLRCVLEKDGDTNETFLSYHPDAHTKPNIDIQNLPSDYYDGDVDSPECLEQLAAAEVTRGMGPTPDDAYGKILWRAVVLEDGWIILVFHHTICDGYSRKIFVKRLVEAISNPNAKLPAMIELQPDAYQLLGTLIHEDEKDEQGDMKEVPPLSPLKPSWPLPDEKAPIVERYNQVPSAIVPNVMSLRDKCRSHGVTVSSAIISALTLAVRRQINISPCQAVDMEKITWGVDIRRHVHNSTNMFGCYVFSDGIEEPISVKQNDSIWSIASNIASTMTKSTALHRAHQKVSQCKEQMEEPMTPDKFMPLLALIDGENQGRNATLNVSNIGLIDGKSTSGTVRVDKLFSISSQTALGSYVWMNTASIEDDLFVTLGSVYPTVSKERGRAMLDDFVRILTDCE